MPVGVANFPSAYPTPAGLKRMFFFSRSASSVMPCDVSAGVSSCSRSHDSSSPSKYSPMPKPSASSFATCKSGFASNAGSTIFGLCCV